VFDDRFQAEAGWNFHEFHPDSAWKRSSNQHETYQWRIYSRELLMMGKEVPRNMQTFITE
jgi:hypothetical protein